MERPAVGGDIDTSPGNSNEQDWFSPTDALTRFAPPKLSDGVGTKSSAMPLRFGFRIGNIGFLLATEMHSELVADTISYPVPNTPPWFHGVMNLRGNLVPVFDLTRLFGGEVQEREKRRLLVVDKGDKTVALLIDGLPEALKASNQPQHPPPLPTILREHVIRVYVVENNLWLDLDFGGFFVALGAQLGK